MPEINAGRFELGTGPTTWMESATMWLGFGAMVVDAMAIFTAQMATMGINWQGSAPTAMAASASAFMGWLAEAEAVCIANAGACTAVATAYAAGTTSMIPTPAVNANRAAEMVAEATNFLGINSGLILQLNAQYAQFWGQNASTMLTYDQAVTTATTPKPISPPPPLASLAAATAHLGEEIAKAAGKEAIGAASQGAMQGLNQSVSATQTGTNAATQAPNAMSSQMSSLMGSAGQFMSMPGQMMGQVGQLGQPLQSLMSPFTSLVSNMGGNLNGSDASAFGMSGPETESGFDGAAMSGVGGGGFAPVGMGGGLGGGLGGSMSHGAYMGASGPAPRSGQVFTGVSGKESELAVAPGASTNGGIAGGGMAPHAPGGGQQAGSARSKGDSIMALQPVKATLSSEEREAEALFRDR